MTTQARHARWFLAFLVALFAAVVGLFSAAPASGAPAANTYDTTHYAYDAPAGLSTAHASFGAARGSPAGSEIVSWASRASAVWSVLAANAAADVSDALVLARGGSNTAERFASGSGVVREADGTLSGVSVNSGRTIEEAAQGIPHSRIGTTTVGDVRQAGGTVALNPLEGNPGHCLLSGCTADTFSQLFTPTIKNPGL